MSAPNGFARHTRPELARLFRALNLDVTYRAGEGDYLTLEHPTDPDGTTSGERVLDLVGGAGASLFGHNHPTLVDVARRSLDERLPFNAQGSVRPWAGELAERLSAMVGASTGASYVVTFGSTGADAVEGAVKHASVEHSRGLGALREEFEQTLRKLRRDGVDDVPCADGPARGRPCGDVVAEAIACVTELAKAEPIFVSLKDSFHGKTSAAGALTHGANVPKDLHVHGPKRIRLHDWTPRSVVSALDPLRVRLDTVTVDAAGVPRSTARHISPVAACFVEPIQGEAGVREVPTATLAALRELADRHDAALVFDEIQCGMGRTGTFLASEPSGVVADYYLLSKSLGGGMVKISALLVAENRYIAEFGRHHTSTFADDDLSARVALAGLDLAVRYQDRITAVGTELRERLTEVAQRWPEAIVEVRGRGLLLGVEFTLPKPGSALLKQVFDAETLGFLIAGRMLHRHRVRVIPTLSATKTLRVQPSALLESADIDQIVAAFDDAASLLAKGDYATLLDHLTVPPTGTWRPRQHVPDPRGNRRPGDGRNEDVPRVVFLANLDTATSLRALAPELASWSEDQCEAAVDRICGELGPFEVVQRRIVSKTGRAVEVNLVAVPFTAAQAVAGQRAGHGAWLRRTVLDAVDLGFWLGADVIGLGGYTSIVTGAGRDVVENEVRVTSGNSLTAACAYDLVRGQLAQAGPGERRVGLVGGLGNIGAVMAELIAPHCEALVLVGRPGSGRRLARVAERLSQLTEVSIAEEMAALRDCPTVVSATNSADPVILPNHLAGDRDVLVCDLAVPGDVHPAVANLSNVTLVSGGRIQLPDGQAPRFPGITLPPGIVYSCMAETILLGFEPRTPSPSYGGLSVAGVHAAQELAARHGLHPARVVADDVTVRPWFVNGSSDIFEERIR
ncbi:Acetylornithine/succinyldiaminopimelate/putrescine aminotransferase [Actinokineospora alba]|uniref:Acetylornithine/succinyldiaminopimelate/putrescine aminotransferase n=1 Tax=Actinokineospora alba TaxID=504798 RepID=A0A1H0FUR9_9PSEU|nr:aminotransferase class III-fold pyridoxal phosphate-dependent enzyme [Actinokineospora alba]TDP69628.1 acetylornithine/succinyldiaminopimelate/putrescine aminotransferase [Actinokineospora alba]SDI12618.1 Acetylornithine/succinyldiaminopimelate/putrescine aminotransferase [Actinokineospora alba]SDN98418.1 Acetylornithine/succinyldiaminopimelate/putrescine aminotransferase [Actinokineospora alba]